jgi:hypothetical protein
MLFSYYISSGIEEGSGHNKSITRGFSGTA